MSASATGGLPPTSSAADAPPVVTIRDVTKTFGGTLALDHVSLDIFPGEIHGLLGENGSGKSTLIKLLGGVHAPDPGSTLEVNGENVDLPLTPGQFRELGFSFVHQDLGLVHDLSVVENLFVDEVVARRGLFISWKAQRRRAAEMLSRYDLEVDPRSTVGALSETQRALVAIVRAIEATRSRSSEHVGPALLVLDEPTVFLPQAGKEQLFRILRTVVSNGDASVLFVSHDLDEVREITDRVTVLRDGRVAGTVVTKNSSVPELVSLIVGRDLDLLERHPGSGRRDRVDYRIRALSAPGLSDIGFDVRRGEIIGLTGLLGSGFEDVPYLLFGARHAADGTLETPEKAYSLPSMTPQRALRAGIALIPADRQRLGCVASLTVAENITLTTLPAFKRPYGLDRRAMSQSASTLVSQFDVRPSDPKALYGSLSGGNQQKAMLAKWLQTKPGLTLLHEPTQGVDIGARSQIFSMLRTAADDGGTVICASADYEQLAAICDRVLLFARRRIVGEIEGAVSKHDIAEKVYSSSG